MDRTGQPGSPTDVTPEWLSQVLRASGALDSGRIVEIGVDLIGADRGFTGVIARLVLQYDYADGNAPATLIAKFPLAERAIESGYRRAPTDSAGIQRQMIERAAREVEFYRAAGPDLPQLPRCYNAPSNVDAGEVVLLLEDLSAGTPGDALSGCSVEEARAVLVAIRDIHERWWRDTTLPALPWLADWSATNGRRAARYREQVPEVIRAYGDRIPGPTVDLMRALVEPFPGVLENLRAAPETLIHADLHLDNVMFVPADGAYQAKLIDWQSPSHGAAMLDIAGFIAESLSIDDRRASECELLREYHDGLLAAGVRGYAFDRLFDDYLRALCVRMAGQVGWLTRVIDDEPEGRERELVEAIFDPGSVFAAVLDHDVVGRELP